MIPCSCFERNSFFRNPFFRVFLRPAPFPSLYLPHTDSAAAPLVQYTPIWQRVSPPSSLFSVSFICLFRIVRRAPGSAHRLVTSSFPVTSFRSISSSFYLVWHRIISSISTMYFHFNSTNCWVDVDFKLHINTESSFFWSICFNVDSTVPYRVPKQMIEKLNGTGYASSFTASSFRFFKFL